MIPSLVRTVLVAALLVAPLTSLGPRTALAADLKVVATFSILADFAREVGGTRVAVKSLVGPNGDAHAFNPTPADAHTLSGANLIVVNGFGLEGWIDRLVKASSARAPVVTASKGVKAQEGGAHGAARGHDHGQSEAHGKTKLDPHAWQSVANARLYVANIRDALIAADPAGKAVYEANAETYIEKLDSLERDLLETIARIPPSRRRIITSHDAFGYFARAYKMQFIAPQGVSTDAEPSAKDVARIIRQIKAEKIPAIFLENITDTRLVERIAAETGAKIGGRIYSDALSDAAGPAPTYLDMMRNNIRAFATALASES